MVEKLDNKGRTLEDVHSGLSQIKSDLDSQSQDIRDYFIPEWNDKNLLSSDEAEINRQAFLNAAFLDEEATKAKASDKPYNAHLMEVLSDAYDYQGRAYQFLLSGHVHHAGYMMDMAQEALHHYEEHKSK
jgi:hypothetical protein